jgi:quinol-cytochrome oxidoreductase complex cytochrome b subunit
LAFSFLLCLPLIFGFFNLIRSFYFKPFTKFIIGIFVVNCLFLGWLGGMPVIEPFFTMGQFVTFMFFAIFFFMGLFGFIEQVIFSSFSFFKQYK